MERGGFRVVVVGPCSTLQVRNETAKKGPAANTEFNPPTVKKKNIKHTTPRTPNLQNIIIITCVNGSDGM